MNDVRERLDRISRHTVPGRKISSLEKVVLTIAVVAGAVAFTYGACKACGFLAEKISMIPYYISGGDYR